MILTHFLGRAKSRPPAVAASRSASGACPRIATLRSGRLELNLVAREARIGDAPLRLGPAPLRMGSKEYLLLEFLIFKRESAVSQGACMTHLYGTDDYLETKTIDVVPRKRLAPYGLAEAIESVWGFNYKLNGPAME
jgi:DNA-binding response OmpR family regulator